MKYDRLSVNFQDLIARFKNSFGYRALFNFAHNRSHARKYKGAGATFFIELLNKICGDWDVNYLPVAIYGIAPVGA